MPPPYPLPLASVVVKVLPEMVELEMTNPDRKREWREFLDQFNEIPAKNSLYICGAGMNMFHVDPSGWLYPCLMIQNVKYPLWSGSFREGWAQGLVDFRSRELNPDSPCSNCREKLACEYCPGFFAMENGDERVPSDYLCSIGKRRFERIYSTTSGG